MLNYLTLQKESENLKKENAKLKQVTALSNIIKKNNYYMIVKILFINYII